MDSYKQQVTRFALLDTSERHDEFANYWLDKALESAKDNRMVEYEYRWKRYKFYSNLSRIARQKFYNMVGV